MYQFKKIVESNDVHDRNETFGKAMMSWKMKVKYLKVVFVKILGFMQSWEISVLTVIRLGFLRAVPPYFSHPISKTTYLISI